MRSEVSYGEWIFVWKYGDKLQKYEVTFRVLLRMFGRELAVEVIT